THELRCHPVLDAEHVVEHEDLAVAVGPAPMPIVGMSIDSVTIAATSVGTPSRTTAKHPACARALASATRRAAASDDVACTLKPPMAWIDCGVRPRWPITGISASTIASITGTRLRPPSSLTHCAPARIRVAALRTASSADTW